MDGMRVAKIRSPGSVSVRSRFASSKRLFSAAVRSKARMTRMPVRFPAG
jgi:hypothetical protein